MPFASRIFIKGSALVAGGILVAIFLILLVRVAYQKAWTASGNSSCLSYVFLPSTPSFEPIRKAVEEVAHSHSLKSQEPNPPTRFYGRWSGPEKLSRYGSGDVSVTLDAYPKDENDAKKMTGHLSVCTEFGDKTELWKVLAKKIEASLAPMVQFRDAVVQLDPRVFGMCASNDRPERFDTVCSIHINTPIDFDRLTVDVLSPRALRVLNDKQ